MLLSLSCRRCFVPACLALSALCVLTVRADTPAAPVTSTVQAAQKIVLQHVVPTDVIKQMHWDQTANLPAGVTQILPVPLQNVLLVTATPAGLVKVQKIVKRLDIAPRQVQVKFMVAYLSVAELRAALSFDQHTTGPADAVFLQTLTKQGSIAVSTVITTANNVNASTSLFYGPKTPVTFAVTPHINSDNSVTLALDVKVPADADTSAIHTSRTVHRGDLLVIGVPPATPRTGKKNFLLFVIPTLLK